MLKNIAKEHTYKPTKVLVKDKDGNVVKVKTIQNLPSMTNQDFIREVDVNYIMDRFTKTGELPTRQDQLVYTGEEYRQPDDLMSSLNTIKNAEKIFNVLNKKLKNRFESPDQLADYLSDPKNHKEAQDLGILPKRDKPDDAKKVDASVDPKSPNDPDPKGTKTESTKS